MEKPQPPMSEVFGLDAFSPREISKRVESVGVVKARMPMRDMLTLGVLAGGFIGLGALYYTLITSDTSLSFGLSRLLGGLVFSLGLILVVVAGAELFTGNNLLIMAWASKKISTCELIRNWVIIWGSNFVGAFGLALIVLLSRHADMNQGAVAVHAVNIAIGKVTLPFWTALFRGILCNLLVCLAVWLAMAGRTVVDKILAIIFPISAFVAAGFEHSVANMYFIPLGIMLKDSVVTAGSYQLTWAGFVMNIVPVTIGNIIGGGGLVALIYYIIYRWGAED